MCMLPIVVIFETKILIEKNCRNSKICYLFKKSINWELANAEIVVNEYFCCKSQYSMKHARQLNGLRHNLDFGL